MAKGKAGSKRPPRKAKPGPWQLAAADGVCLFIFVAVSASFVELAPILAAQLKLQTTVVSIGLLVTLLLLMLPLTRVLGGASLNPANNAALYAIGKGTFKEHAVRAVGQAAGGVAGAAFAHIVLPAHWKPTLSSLAVGLRPGIGLLGGAACEFVLGSLVAFVLLYSGDLRSGFWQVWLPLIATVFAIMAGADVSGPSLNPVYTLSWHFWYGLQSLSEHLLVFWVVPISSSVFGGWAYLGYRAFQQQQPQGKAKTA